MSENLIILGVALGFYPLVVLCVALTGPHSKSERAGNGEKHGG